MHPSVKKLLPLLLFLTFDCAKAAGTSSSAQIATTQGRIRGGKKGLDHDNVLAPLGRHLGFFQQANASRGVLKDTALNIGCISPLTLLETLGNAITYIVDKTFNSPAVTEVVNGTVQTFELVRACQANMAAAVGRPFAPPFL